jgi:phospholipase A1
MRASGSACLKAPTATTTPASATTWAGANCPAFWNVNKDNTLGATLRQLAVQQRAARCGWNGCKAWAAGLGGGKSNLRLHTQLFSGYGDSMIDYNRKRTVFSLG